MDMTVGIFFFLALLSAGLSQGAGGVAPERVSGALGGSVTFTTTLHPADTAFLSVTWTYMNDAGHRTVIITSTSSSNVTAPGYEDRITLIRSTASLELRNLRLHDSGEYRVSVVPDVGVSIEGVFTLKVYKKRAVISSAEAAGITAACLIAVLLLVFLIVWTKRNKTCECRTSDAASTPKGSEDVHVYENECAHEKERV